jgi:DNA mismatch endonuclease, patch repair protein
VVDNLTPEQRRYTMSRIRSTDTGPELAIRHMVHARGLRFRKHAAWLPGRPDLVFSGPKVVVFVDGDYWHGWKFSLWKHKLAPYWQMKIARNRQRDVKNFAKLRRDGWLVVRVWEHAVKQNVVACVTRIEKAVRQRAQCRGLKCR